MKIVNAKLSFEIQIFMLFRKNYLLFFPTLWPNFLYAEVLSKEIKNVLFGNFGQFYLS